MVYEVKYPLGTLTTLDASGNNVQLYNKVLVSSLNDQYTTEVLNNGIYVKDVGDGTPAQLNIGNLDSQNLSIISGTQATTASMIISNSNQLELRNYDNNVQTRSTILNQDELTFYDSADITSPVATINITGVSVSTTGDPSINCLLNSTTLYISSLEKQTILNDALRLNNFTGDPLEIQYISTYAQASLSSDVPVYDISVNSLKLCGVASTEGQFLRANVDGKPVWATLPSEVIPTLSQVLEAGSSAGSTGINMNFNDITNINNLYLKVNGGTTNAEITDQSVVFGATGANENATLQIVPNSGGELKLKNSANYKAELTASGRPQLLLEGVTGNVIINSTQILVGGTDSGSTGDVITSDGANFSWQALPVSTLDSILDVSGNAGNNPVSNLASVAFAQVSTDTALILESDPAGGTVLKLNTPPDVSGDTKSFSSKYLPIRLGNDLYYLQLFKVPV